MKQEHRSPQVITLVIVMFFLATIILAQNAAISSPPPAGITVSALETRISDLQKQKDQAIANVNALSGAIQDCQYWLDQLKDEEKVKTEKEPAK